MNKTAEKVFKMMSFQYKPLETDLLSTDNNKFKTWYKNLDYAKKIIVLDRYARALGL